MFKEFSGNFECCICKFAFKNIANHLRRDHQITNVQDFLDLIQQPYSQTLDLSETPTLSSYSEVQILSLQHKTPFRSDSRLQSVNNYVEKEKFGSFIDFHIEKKGKGQVCNFCGTSCLRENLPRHYSNVHRAEAWSNLTFPGPNAFKRYCESDDATICLFCRHEENGPSNGLVFIDIASIYKNFTNSLNQNCQLF